MIIMNPFVFCYDFNNNYKEKRRDLAPSEVEETWKRLAELEE